LRFVVVFLVAAFRAIAVRAASLAALVSSVRVGPLAAIVVASACGLADLGCAAHGQPRSSTPDDVAQFVERRQTCDHFRGEEPYSPERRAEIEAASDKFCRGTDRELAALRSKYRDNAAILKVLDAVEMDIEAK
jgi:hypothetical protein